MKKSLLTFAITSLLMHSNTIVAQDDAGSNQALSENSSGQLYIPARKSDAKAIGSPYLVEKFTPATISAIPNKIVKARYNAYDDEIEIRIDEDNIQNFNKNIKNVFITFLVDDTVFTTLKYINPNDGLQTGYFVTLTEANTKAKLYLKKEIRFVEAKPAVSGYDRNKPAEFKSKNDTYFISINDAYARELPSKKKDLVKLFPENSKEISAFIKDNKIKTSRETDLITLIDYINSI
jgi:hypothetical protein